MAYVTLSDLLEDLRTADQTLRKFEQRYWITSKQFYELYAQGLLDDGENLEEFSEWAGFYKLKLKRERALEQLSTQRVNRLPRRAGSGIVELTQASLFWKSRNGALLSS